MVNIAIIGSGPSGCYIADMLSKKVTGAQIDIYDRLPTPFGLVRAGVAPDHQGTKNIIRQFERTLSRENVRFIGNVTIGRDISYDELKAHYDVVAITVGAVADRALNIPGESLSGVYGSGAFATWFNSHPDQADLKPDLSGNAVAIIGNGNVSLDIARILAKTPAELEGSDINTDAAHALANSGVQDIYLIGRRSPLESSFGTMELGELATLARCTTQVDPDQLPTTLPDDFPADARYETEKRLELLQGYAQSNDATESVRLHLIFCASPIEILEDSGRVRGLRLERNTLVDGQAQGSGETFELEVQTVISAIGYRSSPIEGVPFDDARGIVRNDDGEVESGVYTAGWCKRGPQGVIPANRADAMAVAKKIISALEATPAGSAKAGFDAVAVLLDARQVRSISFAEWQQIDAAEISRACDGKPREKFNRTSEMLAVLG